MAIDDGPVETMPHMSPSCSSVVRIFLNSSRSAAGVAEVEVQIVDDEQQDAAGGVGGRPRRRQDDALLRRRRRRRRDVEDAAAVDQRERDERLRHAVLEDLELVLLEVGDEQPLVVAGDHVGRHQVDAGA